MFVDLLLSVVTFYLLCGLVFVVPFIIKGVTVIDAGAYGSSIGFRIIIIPGVIVFWPLLLMKWINAKSTGHDKTA